MTEIIATNLTSAVSNWREEIEPLTAVERDEIQHLADHYPKPQAATIEALKVVQRDQGWVSDGKVKAIAEQLNMSPDEVDSVATFYNRIYRKPVARTVVTICDSVSCWVMRSDDLISGLTNHLDISLGESTADNQITLLPTPCLGACDRAPVVMVGDKLMGPLNTQELIEAVEQARGGGK